MDIINAALPFDINIAIRFAVAVALGVLLGLERERSHLIKEETIPVLAGARTLGLVSLMGGMAAFVQENFGADWFMIMLFSGVTGLVLISYAITAYRGALGMTTEVSVMFAFVLGALCLWGAIELAVALSIIGLLLLSIKRSMRHLVTQIHTEDIQATLKFAVITAIILPLLPNENFGPQHLDLAVINPYKIWLMVVLISGLNFVSYILVKIVGQEHGIALTGFLGGMVSSTATTLGFAQRSNTSGDSPSSLAMGILLSWTIMFIRTLVVVAILSPVLAKKIAVVMVAMTLLNLGLCLYLWWQERSKDKKALVTSGANPFELMEAVKFGLLFGVVMFLAKAAEVYFGRAGLYIAAGVAGLTDVDAISLSMANLAQDNADMLHAAGIAIIIAIMANTVFKTGLVVFTASSELRKTFLPWSGTLLFGGSIALFFTIQIG